MPATAAIDNKTLDHLLSIVDDMRNCNGRVEDLKASISGGRRKLAGWTFPAIGSPVR
jgi:hypothetical protein